MAFTEKDLKFEFNLATGNFQGGGNTLTISGLRATVRIIVAGGVGIGSLQAAIYGMTLDQMNQLTIVGLTDTKYGKNLITVSAGDLGGQMSMVFQGYIYTAYMDALSAPDVPFRVYAQAATHPAVKPIPPTSVKGSGDVATMMASLAKQMGVAFENNGVNVQLQNEYLPGSLYSQVQQLAHHAGIEYVLEKGVLAIWKPGEARSRRSVLLISKDTIEYSYPGVTSNGIAIKTYWDPALEYGIQIEVQSDVTPACGLWYIYMLEFDLSCFLPHGPWFALISASKQGGKDMPVY